MKHLTTLLTLVAIGVTTAFAQRETWQLNPRFDLGFPMGEMSDIESVGTAFGVGLGAAYHVGNAAKHAILADVDFGLITTEVDGFDPAFYVGLGAGYGFNLTDSESPWIVRPQLTFSFTRVQWYDGDQELPDGFGSRVTYDSDPASALFIRPGILGGYQIGNLWIGAQLQYSTGSFDVEYNISSNNPLVVIMPSVLTGEVDWQMIQFSPTLVINL